MDAAWWLNVLCCRVNRTPNRTLSIESHHALNVTCFACIYTPDRLIETNLWVKMLKQMQTMLVWHIITKYMNLTCREREVDDENDIGARRSVVCWDMVLLAYRPVWLDVCWVIMSLWCAWNEWPCRPSANKPAKLSIVHIRRWVLVLILKMWINVSFWMLLFGWFGYFAEPFKLDARAIWHIEFLPWFICICVIQSHFDYDNLTDSSKVKLYYYGTMGILIQRNNCFLKVNNHISQPDFRIWF